MPIPDDHKVSLRVAGMDYAGWKDVRISAGIERQARDFSLSVAWRWDGQAVDLPIKQGAKTEVRIGQDLVLTGWVFAALPLIGAALAFILYGQALQRWLEKLSPGLQRLLQSRSSRALP